MMSASSRYGIVLLMGVVLSLPATAAQGPLRTLIRDRLAERAAQQAGPEVPTKRLAAGEKIREPGRYEIRLRHDGLERAALVHVPRNHRPGQATPW
jgi:hypothetical protein